MTRSFVIVPKGAEELQTTVSLVAIVADVVVVNFIIARPCAQHPSLLSYSCWSLVSEYNAAEVKAKAISSLIPVRIVLKSSLKSLAAL